MITVLCLSSGGNNLSNDFNRFLSHFFLSASYNQINLKTLKPFANFGGRVTVLDQHTQNTVNQQHHILSNTSILKTNLTALHVWDLKHSHEMFHVSFMSFHFVKSWLINMTTLHSYKNWVPGNSSLLPHKEILVK